VHPTILGRRPDSLGGVVLYCVCEADLWCRIRHRQHRHHRSIPSKKSRQKQRRRKKKQARSQLNLQPYGLQLLPPRPPQSHQRNQPYISLGVDIGIDLGPRRAPRFLPFPPSSWERLRFAVCGLNRWHGLAESRRDGLNSRIICVRPIARKGDFGPEFRPAWHRNAGFSFD